MSTPSRARSTGIDCTAISNNKMMIAKMIIAQNRSTNLSQISYVPPRHPALGVFNPDKFPWQRRSEWFADKHRYQVYTSVAAAVVASALPGVDGGGAPDEPPLNTNRGGNKSQPEPTPVDRIEVVPTTQGRFKVKIHPASVEGYSEVAHIDTLTFTVPEKAIGLDTLPTVAAKMDYVRQWLGAAIGLGPEKTHKRSGLNFYKERYDLTYTSVTSEGEEYEFKNLGHVLIGHDNQTICVNLTGEACESIPPGHFLLLEQSLRKASAKITRVDMAHDDFDGERPVDYFIDAYMDGGFKSLMGGRNPSFKTMGNFHFEDGEGRTLYIGKRKNGKMLRVYEKGKQLGDPESLWVRVEGELRSTDRVIPLDVLTRPGDYLKGMYPVLDYLKATSEVVKTLRVKVEITLKALKQHCSRAYGGLLGTLRGLGVSSEEIVSELATDKVPAKLVMPAYGAAVDSAPVF